MIEVNAMQRMPSAMSRPSTIASRGIGVSSSLSKYPLSMSFTIATPETAAAPATPCVTATGNWNAS